MSIYARFLVEYSRGNIIWRGDPGKETFHGKNGDDLISGWTGNDRLYGNKGNDALYGQEDNDRLYGEAGNDTLDGGIGKDWLKGGGGIDTFVFSTKYGKDTIADFKATGDAHDIVDLGDLHKVKDWDDLKENHMEKAGKDVVIDGGGGAVLTLEHVKMKHLDETDFSFF